MSTPVLDMIFRSGPMGRIIIGLLMVLSLVTWAIIFNRFFALGKIRSGNSLFRRKYDGLKRISEIENMEKQIMTAPMAKMGQAGAAEYRRILEDARSHTGVKDWSFFLQNQFMMARDKLESVFIAAIQPFDKGVFLLAMISSIAPFLGLLGTVWGIMNSFYEIGNQGSASLPVVAPGIAEALITTVVGLAVAIPALFFYNYFNHKAERVENEMDEFKDILLVRLKREIFNLLYTDKPSKA